MLVLVRRDGSGNGGNICHHSTVGSHTCWANTVDWGRGEVEKYPSQVSGREVLAYL